jgi:hypothetical protein
VTVTSSPIFTDSPGRLLRISIVAPHVNGVSRLNGVSPLACDFERPMRDLVAELDLTQR